MLRVRLRRADRGVNMLQDSQQIRVFFAIELPDPVKSFLKELSTELRLFGGDVKWVNPMGMHLTLKFLGEIRTDLLPAIEQQVRPIFAGQKASVHHVSRLGAFPDLRKPRVVWVGCTDDAGALAPMASKLEESLEPLGFPREKRGFKAHLTLGRVRSSKGVTGLVEGIRHKMEIAGPSFVADHAVLFQSILKPSGAEYSPLLKFDFRA